MLLSLLIWPFTLPSVIVLLLVALGSFLMLLVLGHNIGLTALSFLFVPWCYLLLGLMVLCGQQKICDVARGNFTDRLAAAAVDLNPFQSGLAFKLVLLLMGVVALVLLAPQQKLLLAVVAIIYPLFYLALALEESLRDGLRPAVLWGILRGSGVLYPLLTLLLSGSAVWFAYVLIYDQRLLVLIAATYAYLLAQPLAGRLLYLRRNELLLHTDFSPEQQRATLALEQSQALEDQLDTLNRLCSSGAVKQANIKLDLYLGEQRESLDPVVHERLRDLQYTRLFLEHGVYYLQRLTERGALKKAWAVFKDCYAFEERFRPLSAQVLLDITQVAEREDALLVDTLLADFAVAYPESELIALGLFRRARINIELLGEGDRGISLLKQLETVHSGFVASETYKNYRARLRIRQLP